MIFWPMKTWKFDSLNECRLHFSLWLLKVKVIAGQHFDQTKSQTESRVLGI